MKFPYDYCNRMVHSFTCAGVVGTQCEKVSRFAGLGSLRKNYIGHGICTYCIRLCSAQVIILYSLQAARVHGAGMRGSGVIHEGSC